MGPSQMPKLTQVPVKEYWLSWSQSAALGLDGHFASAQKHPNRNPQGTQSNIQVHKTLAGHSG